LEALGAPDPYGDGVLRFSFVHYNTVEDAERIITMLKNIGF
jgi:selenocysteine lyase/cysteine desulfurase